MFPESRDILAGVASLFGLFFGSFLNVCIYRIPRDVSIVFPRSFCPECGRTIAWYDNIPVISYSVLLGHCRKCGKAIGLRYPAVEIATAVLFGAVVLRYGFSWAALKWLTLEALLVLLFWTDLEERILPDELTLGGTLFGFVFALFVPVQDDVTALWMGQTSLVLRSIFSAFLGAALFALLFWAVASLYTFVRKRQALGLGDIKLLMLIGSFLGLQRGLFALLLGTLAGAILGFLYVVIRREEIQTYELPFGSFLCLGAAIIPFTNR